ncbi:MAG: formyltetrahydrofolate deformylase [Nitrosarchaeum sp.]|nr:formyltetrahydrofolate deformylase [Nitrosarchaeum sp.]MCA9820750.1 formyltetrahydrofolate deformylase [Nitrosarchaeum sp.]
MMKIVIGITVVGRDREGIVAVFTNFVFEKGGNIEKVNQNVIKGLFGMYLEASFTKQIDIKQFDSAIQTLAKKEKMDVSVHHETNSQKKIALFVTKEPLCLQTILNAKTNGLLKDNISVIVGTENTLENIAKKARIPFISVEDKNQEQAETKIIDVCRKHDIDLIVLARYMRILTPNFVWRYPNRIINIHPSLLPAFPGAMAYAQAFERGTKIVGVTSHYVTENLDQGPIIFQDSFKVDPNDTLEEIKSKGQKLEAQTLLKAVKLHLENKLEVRWRKVHIK